MLAIVVAGCGRHGKDTAAEFLRDAASLRFIKSTALFAADVVFAQLKDRFGYTTSEECFADRGNHRELWADIIGEYNGPTHTGLYREMLKTHDILCGMRRIEELKAVQMYQLAGPAIWIDASKRRPPDSSCTIRPEDCDFFVDNNGSVDQLYTTLYSLIPAILANANSLAASTPARRTALQGS